MLELKKTSKKFVLIFKSVPTGRLARTVFSAHDVDGDGTVSLGFTKPCSNISTRSHSQGGGQTRTEVKVEEPSVASLLLET